MSWKANKLGIKTDFIKLAGEINSSIPTKILNKINNIFKTKNIKNIKILILGIAYKKNVNDLRESPGIKILDLLLKKKYKVKYSDPLISKIPRLRNFRLNLKSIKLNSKNIRKFDLVILTTDHDVFNYKLIYNSSKLILDTRGVYRKDKDKKVIYNFH